RPSDMVYGPSSESICCAGDFWMAGTASCWPVWLPWEAFLATPNSCFSTPSPTVPHNRMKILELNLERGWRGGERQTLWSAIRFREAGHDVALLAREGEPLALAAAEAGLTVHGLKGSSQVLPFLAGQGRRFDILHSQTA